jgi:hypothetical protein
MRSLLLTKNISVTPLSNSNLTKYGSPLKINRRSSLKDNMKEKILSKMRGTNITTCLVFDYYQRQLNDVMLQIKSSSDPSALTLIVKSHFNHDTISGE